MKAARETEVRIVYHRSGFESRVGHQVRTRMEATVCDWLMEHRIAHRHGSEVFTVRVGAASTPTIYVPDIVLHDRDKEGRTVIIDPYDASSPRVGSTRIISVFRKEMKTNYFVIIIVKKHQRNKILKDSYDLLVEFNDLDSLEQELPLPPE